MEVCMKQRYVLEFLHADKMAPTDIHQCSLTVYGDQTEDVSTVRVGCVFQKWQQQQWVIFAGADFCKYDTLALVQHWQKNIVNCFYNVEK